MSRTNFRVNLHSIVCLDVKEPLAWSRHHIWSLSGRNEIRTHNHLVRKRTLKHLVKLAKWSSCVVSSILYGAFDYMLISCHVQVSEWIHTLHSLPECQRSSGWKLYWKFSAKCAVQVSTHNTTQSFGPFG